MGIAPLGTPTAGSTGASSPVTTLTVNVPTAAQGVTDANTLLLFSACGTATSIADIPTPTGWSIWQANLSAGSNWKHVTFYRFASAEPTSYTISGLTGGRYSGNIRAYSGADGATPQDVTPTTNTSGAAMAAPAAITPATAGAWIDCTNTVLTASSTTGTTWTSSNMTKDTDWTSTHATLANAAGGTGHFAAWASGAFTPNLTQTTSTATRGASITSAIRPQVAASTAADTPYVPSKVLRGGVLVSTDLRLHSLANSKRVRPKAPGTSLPLITPIRAFDMLDSIGARTSMSEGGAGDAYADVTLVQTTLTDLRIGHIRENQVHATAHPTTFPRQRDAWQTLHTNIGTRVMGPLGRPDATSVATGGDGTVQDFATQVKTVYGGFAGGIIEGAENGNEWNGANGPGSTLTFDPTDGATRKLWAVQLRQWQKDIDTYFRNDAAGSTTLQGILSIGPSLVGGPGIGKYNDLGDVSQWTDRGNYHYYTDTDPVPTYLVPQYPTSMAVCCGTQPIWCTETGINNAVNQTAGLASHPESIAAVYMPRLLLEHKWFGNERTYQFELLDDHDNQVALDNPEDNWGVVRFDGTQKPVYATWKTMADTIYDSGVTAATFTPAALPMTLTGPSDMRYLLFAKSNGHYVLAIWRNVSIWNASTRVVLTVSPVNAVLTLASVTDLTIRNGLASSTTNTSSTTATVALAGDMALINIGGS